MLLHRRIDKDQTLITILLAGTETLVYFLIIIIILLFFRRLYTQTSNTIQCHNTYLGMQSQLAEE